MLRVDEQWVDRTRVGAGGGEPSDVSRSCYEFALVLSNLHDVEAQARGRGGGAHADQDVDGLWRKRVEAAEDIVNAGAPTIQGVILKVAMTRLLLSESALVGLTAQCLSRDSWHSQRIERSARCSSLAVTGDFPAKSYTSRIS